MYRIVHRFRIVFGGIVHEVSALREVHFRLSVRRDHHAVVDIQSEEIQRLSGQFKVVRLHLHKRAFRLQVGQQVIGVVTGKNGIAVEFPVALVLIHHQIVIRLRFSQRMTLPDVNDHTDPGVLRSDGTERLNALTMRYQNIVSCLVAPHLVGVSRCKSTKRVADVGCNRFVDGRPHRHNVPEGAEHLFGILAEPLDGVPVDPTALILQHLRQIPVIQRDGGGDPGFFQLLKATAVVIHTLLVKLSRPVRQDARPRNGHPVGIESQCLHVAQVAVKLMVAVAGNRRSLAPERFARFCRKGVPDGGCASVLERAPLDLAGTGGTAPQKILRKRHCILSFFLLEVLIDPAVCFPHCLKSAVP